MAERDWLFSLADISAALPNDPEVMRFHYALRHGTMKVGLYAPRGPDIQPAHRQDELYIVAAGKGVFTKAGEKRRFKAGDVIFVEAGVQHRFEDFSDDFAAWVVFWGPEGGEH